MAFSREIIKKILQNVRFRVPKNERDSYYTTINNTLVRVSNHCTRLYVWDNFLEENPKCKGMPIVSIVFEDEEDTFIEEECLVLKRNRKKPVKVKEYVYRLQGNPHFIEKNDEKLIIQSIKNISGQYIDKTGKSESFLRVSRNPGTNENKQYNKNTNMNKKLIRLTENDLHRIVKESVKKVLKEGVFDSKRIQAELDNSLGGGAMVADFHSSDDMVTIIAQPNAVDSHELDTVMNELGYMYYRMQPKAYDAYLFIHKDSLGKYYDDETTNRLKMEHGFDY